MIEEDKPNSSNPRRYTATVKMRIIPQEGKAFVEIRDKHGLLAEANDALKVSATAKRRGYQISAAKLAFACMVYFAGIIHENENMRIQYEDIVTDTFTHAVMLLGFTSGDDVAVAVRQCQDLFVAPN